MSKLTGSLRDLKANGPGHSPTENVEEAQIYLPEARIVTVNSAKPRVFELPRAPGVAQLSSFAREKLLRKGEHRAWIKDRKSVEYHRAHLGSGGGRRRAHSPEQSAGSSSCRKPEKVTAAQHRFHRVGSREPTYDFCRAGL